jgi:hypothetical protein
MLLLVFLNRMRKKERQALFFVLLGRAARALLHAQ